MVDDIKNRLCLKFKVFINKESRWSPENECFVLHRDGILAEHTHSESPNPNYLLFCNEDDYTIVFETGVKDSEGKEIYHHDKLEVTHLDGSIDPEILEVKAFDAAGGFYVDIENGDADYEWIWGLMQSGCYRVRVVGNTLEDPPTLPGVGKEQGA